MSLSEVSIRRPVFATVMSLIILLIGLMAYSRLSVREYPKIDEPVVSVTTTYKGASSEIIESQVTRTMEESLAGIEGIDVMTSISKPEESQINVRFRINRDPDAAAADVRDRVGRARDALPDEIDEPVIAKVEADSQPVMYLAFASTRHNAMEVTDFADRVVKDRLQNLPGVAEIQIYGEREQAMRIWLDRLRLAAFNLTPQDVETALRMQNVEVPAGRIEGVDREFTVLSETDLRTSEQFNDLIIRDTGGYLVRLKDVGRAEIAALDERIIARFNGNPAVAIGVIKQSTANPLDVSNEVKKALPQIEAALPLGMKVDVAYDSSIFIATSIENVFTAIGEAIVLVVIVIFVFLRSFRATLIPIVTIPVSLVGAFIFMWALDFSINTLTLLALVLAVGLVVDDAIVMLENISRHVEDGMKPFQAALVGAKEIQFAIIAMTISLVAVYAPIAFQTGRTGRLFIEFALTLACAVLVSGFMALTLSPMMCSLILKHQERHNFLYRFIEGLLNGLTNGYRRALRFVLTVRLAVVVAGLLVAGCAWFLLRSLPSELSPTEDRGTIISIGIAPEGSTVDFTDRYVREMEKIFAGTEYMDRFFAVVGFPAVTQGLGFIGLVDWDKRPVSQQQIAAEMSPKLFGIPALLAFAVNPPSLGQSPIDKPIEFVLQTSSPYEELQKGVDAMLAALAAEPRLVNVDTDLKLNKPQIKFEIDREKAALMGLDIDTIGRTVETMLGGRQVTRFKREGKQYDVVVQLADTDRTSRADLDQIFVRSGSGQMVPLASLVTSQETVAPKELNHFNKLRSASITATLAPGYTTGDALNFLESTFARLQEEGKIPQTIIYDLNGESREFKVATGGLYVTFLLALAFIYLVLAAQFESWIDPFVIMLTVPLSMTGALLALKLTGGSINVYSQIGLVTLVGLITKHGILIVEFTNQLREQGRDIRDAVIEASVLRLRPILMTTGAMVLGSVPLALAVGAGAESRHAIGWVIVGGLTLGTFFTLFVVPVAYTLLSRRVRPSHAAAATAHPQPAE
jgi:multidrug efflux pump